MEFFDITEQECVDRISAMLSEWEKVNYRPKGWRNPGWICKEFCIKHLSKKFEWAALHYQHNFNYKWDLKMIFGADSINTEQVDLHDGHIMFHQDHGLAPCRIQLKQKPDHIFLFLKRHSSKGFVQHQKFWLQG